MEGLGIDNLVSNIVATALCRAQLESSDSNGDHRTPADDSKHDSPSVFVPNQQIETTKKKIGFSINVPPAEPLAHLTRAPMGPQASAVFECFQGSVAGTRDVNTGCTDVNLLAFSHAKPLPAAASRGPLSARGTLKHTDSFGSSPGLSLSKSSPSKPVGSAIDFASTAATAAKAGFRNMAIQVDLPGPLAEEATVQTDRSDRSEGAAWLNNEHHMKSNHGLSRLLEFSSWKPTYDKTTLRQETLQSTLTSSRDPGSTHIHSPGSPTSAPQGKELQTKVAIVDDTVHPLEMSLSRTTPAAFSTITRWKFSETMSGPGGESSVLYIKAAHARTIKFPKIQRAPISLLRKGGPDVDTEWNWSHGQRNLDSSIRSPTEKLKQMTPFKGSPTSNSTPSPDGLPSGHAQRTTKGSGTLISSRSPQTGDGASHVHTVQNTKPVPTSIDHELEGSGPSSGPGSQAASGSPRRWTGGPLPPTAAARSCMRWPASAPGSESEVGTRRTLVGPATRTSITNAQASAASHGGRGGIDRDHVHVTVLASTRPTAAAPSRDNASDCFLLSAGSATISPHVKPQINFLPQNTGAIKQLVRSVHNAHDPELKKSNSLRNKFALNDRERLSPVAPTSSGLSSDSGPKHNSRTPQHARTLRSGSAPPSAFGHPAAASARTQAVNVAPSRQQSPSRPKSDAQNLSEDDWKRMLTMVRNPSSNESNYYNKRNPSAHHNGMWSQPETRNSSRQAKLRLGQE